MIALSQCPGIDPVKDSSAALQAALNLRQPMMWDCPVNCIMGSDITKSVFVPDGSDVTFTPQGRLDVDNVGFPALAFMHAAGIWRGMKLRYVGNPGVAMPLTSGNWTSITARNYLAQQGFNTVFNGVGGTWWTSPTNTSALISVRGASNVNFQGGKIYVDDGAPASQLAPVAFGLDLAFVPGEVCTPTAALVAPNVSFSDFTLDGVLMGFVGGGNQVSFSNITRLRYSDMQDAAGGNVGGVNNWSAPPHFFYLQGSPANPLTLKMKNIYDNAIHIGNPLRRTGPAPMNSLKVELANGSSIDGYFSRCLDGGFGVLSNGSTVGGTMKNAHFLIDSSLLTTDGKPANAPGIFFPSAHPYPVSDIDISVTDQAARIWPVDIRNWPPGMRIRANAQLGVGA